MMFNVHEHKDIKLIIFDMDGLMFDTERLGIEGWKYAFNYFGLPIPYNALVNKIGLNAADSKKVIMDEAGHSFDYDAVKAVKIKYVNEYIMQNGTPIKKGLFELLTFIDSLRIKKVVATSRRHEISNIYLSKANVENAFDAIITGDMVAKGKPNPDIFLYACNLFNISPSDCIVLEDSMNGIKAAFRAGMLPIMVPDLVEPNEEIEKMLFTKCNSLFDVLEVLKNL